MIDQMERIECASGCLEQLLTEKLAQKSWNLYYKGGFVVFEIARICISRAAVNDHIKRSTYSWNTKKGASCAKL